MLPEARIETFLCNFYIRFYVRKILVVRGGRDRSYDPVKCRVLIGVDPREMKNIAGQAGRNDSRAELAQSGIKVT